MPSFLRCFLLLMMMVVMMMMMKEATRSEDNVLERGKGIEVVGLRNGFEEGGGGGK